MCRSEGEPQRCPQLCAGKSHFLLRCLFPELAQEREHGGRKRNLPVGPALGVADYHNTSRTVYVGGGQPTCLTKSQSTGIDKLEAGTETQSPELAENDEDFVTRQDHRQMFPALWDRHAGQREVALQSGFNEELDAA